MLVLDDESKDRTKEIADKYQARVEKVTDLDFAQKRTEGLALAQTEWIFYVDADEVISDELKQVIQKIVSENLVGAYRIKRRNWFLDQEMYPDYVDRLFHKSIITGWTGKVHESPVLIQTPKTIEAVLIHHTHRDITSMLTKTNQWSEYEAALRFEAKHPPMAGWRLIRMGVTSFWSNFINKKLFRFGRPGLFEAYFQMVDKLVVYVKLWERQQKHEL